MNHGKTEGYTYTNTRTWHVVRHSVFKEMSSNECSANDPFAQIVRYAILAS